MTSNLYYMWYIGQKVKCVDNRYFGQRHGLIKGHIYTIVTLD